MKIIYIQHYAGSSDLGPSKRVYDHSLALKEYGHEIHIIAASFSHLRNKQPIVKGIYASEIIDGINYHFLRTPKYSGLISRFLNILVFNLLLVIFLPFFIKIRPEAVISTSTYQLDYIPNYLICLFSGAKSVHEVHDLWPESLRYTSGMSRFHPFFLVCRLSELLAFKKADAIIGILEHTDRYAEEILGISINKYLWVPNHCNLEDYSGINPIKKDRFTVTYTGYLGEAQYLQDLFEAVKDLPIDVCIYGDGPKKIFFEDQCRSMKINNVYFYGRTPREEIIKQQISANVLYQGWKDYSIYEYGVSSIKIPEYIASGAYVVQTANFKDHLIDSYDYGISVPLGNVDQLRKILFKLFSEKDENNSELRRIDGMKYIKNNLSLEIMSKRVNDFLNHT